MDTVTPSYTLPWPEFFSPWVTEVVFAERQSRQCRSRRAVAGARESSSRRDFGHTMRSTRLPNIFRFQGFLPFIFTFACDIVFFVQLTMITVATRTCVKGCYFDSFFWLGTRKKRFQSIDLMKVVQLLHHRHFFSEENFCWDPNRFTRPDMCIPGKTIVITQVTGPAPGPLCRSRRLGWRPRSLFFVVVKSLWPVERKTICSNMEHAFIFKMDTFIERYTLSYSVRPLHLSLALLYSSECQ